MHAEVAKRFGVAPERLAALADRGPDEARDGRLAPLLRYCAKLTQTPSRMTEADAASVKAAGWDDTALFHAVLITALFNGFNRIADGLGLDASRVDFDRAAKGIHEIGYEGRL
jgi:alkylhydroperoxidase family enzyme